MSDAIFEMYNLGPLTLRNRIVMAPMTRCRALNNVPNELMAEYYGQRAHAGLMISEGIAPSPNGLGYARIPGLFSNEQVEGWKLVNTAVHRKAGKLFAQLMHTGRVAHPDNMPKGSRILAPSAVAAKGEMWTDGGGMQAHPVPEEMTRGDIEAATAEYEQAAANAIAAGFQGVELHGANGYLIEQFINPTTNLRTDAYGGSEQKRARFLIEIIERVAARIGAGRVGVRLSPHGVFNDMGTYDGIESQYTLIAKECARLDIAYIHTIRGKHVKFETLMAMRMAFGKAFILNGGYTLDEAKAAIAENQASLISFGSSFLANPDLVERMQSGAELNAPDSNTFYTAGPEGYTDYPTLDDSTSGESES